MIGWWGVAIEIWMVNDQSEASIKAIWTALSNQKTVAVAVAALFALMQKPRPLLDTNMILTKWPVALKPDFE